MFIKTLLASTVILLATCVGAKADTSWTVDTHRSHATFSVAHVFVDDVQGNVPIVDGEASYSSDGMTLKSVEATLNPSGIATDDATRDRDLRGKDWFDVSHYPTWRFVSTRITRQAGKIVIDGNLSIHGTTAQASLDATELPPKDGERHYHASTIVDRHRFGIRGTRMDALIGDKVQIDLDIFLRKI
jgi:polyisoprenoid-binding protein YceI